MNSLNPSQSLKADRTVKTYGQLKLELIQGGLFIPKAVLEVPEVARGVCPGSPGEEVALTLAENFIVKVLLKSDGRGRMRLKVHQGNVLLDTGSGEEGVGVIPLPLFLKNQLKERTPVAENVCLDGFCLNIFLRAIHKGRRLSISKDQILLVVQSAFEEGAADLVQLNMDYCDDEDRGFQLLAPVVEAIKKKFKTFVALKGFPPQERRTVDLMYAAGFDLLDFPLGGFAGSDPSGEMAPPHQVHDALEYAIGIFPPGTVWSELVLASEPIDLVKKKLDLLTGRGIIPLLKLVPSSIHTGKDYWRVREVVRHLEKAAQRDKLPLKWLYPHCRCVSPLDTRFYTHDPKQARLAVKPVYRSRLGKKASEGFAALRRKLRIKNVSDSYESAGL
ncbi:MAG: hypothetical protein ACE5E9_02475 [Nitrospinaceae bacterium]